ncbi:hypothetical protein PR048_009040 [Dryococelus australis]|uniref:Uncharacterized protein n=1 Tax=Dryococelus australis TaxID=614101 RepID=A0ABQ9HYT1_9NEOP|nr:hypothetical protein PR048_009040 [Dryococelus australis]
MRGQLAAEESQQQPHEQGRSSPSSISLCHHVTRVLYSHRRHQLRHNECECQWKETARHFQHVIHTLAEARTKQSSGEALVWAGENSVFASIMTSRSECNNGTVSITYERKNLYRPVTQNSSISRKCCFFDWKRNKIPSSASLSTAPPHDPEPGLAARSIHTRARLVLETASHPSCPRWALYWILIFGADRKETRNEPPKHFISACLHTDGGRGGVINSLLVSHVDKWRLIPGGVALEFSRVGMVTDYAASRRVFSGISRFPRPCIPALLHSHLPSHLSTLKTSVLRATQISSLYFPPTLCFLLDIYSPQPNIPEKSRRSEASSDTIPTCENPGVWAAVNIEILRADEGEARCVWNGAGMKGRRETGDLRENPPTSGIARHHSHMRQSGSGLTGKRSPVRPAPYQLPPPAATRVGVVATFQQGGAMRGKTFERRRQILTNSASVHSSQEYCEKSHPPTAMSATINTCKRESRCELAPVAERSQPCWEASQRSDDRVNQARRQFDGMDQAGARRLMAAWARRRGAGGLTVPERGPGVLIGRRRLQRRRHYHGCYRRL